jgi:transposase
LTDTLPDVALLLVDSTAVRAHGHAAGARGGTESQALGRSRGGFGTKVHAAVSEGGRLLSVAFTGAQRSDLEQAESLLSAVTVGYGTVVADKAYDCDRFVQSVSARGCAVAIASRKGRRRPRWLDRPLYRERNVIERFFGRVKQFRRIATRYDKTTASFESFFFVAAAIMLQTGWT